MGKKEYKGGQSEEQTLPRALFQQIQTRSFPDKTNVVTCHFTPFRAAPHAMIPLISKHSSPEMFKYSHPHQFLLPVTERGRDYPLLRAGKTEMQKDTAYLGSLHKWIAKTRTRLWVPRQLSLG